MLTANFFETFYRELLDFLKDAKDIFVDTISYFHKYLNRFFPDDVLVIFLITIGAILLILIFRSIINR